MTFFNRLQYCLCRRFERIAYCRFGTGGNRCPYCIFSRVKRIGNLILVEIIVEGQLDHHSELVLDELELVALLPQQGLVSLQNEETQRLEVGSYKLGVIGSSFIVLQACKEVLVKLNHELGAVLERVLVEFVFGDCTQVKQREH